jgi:hypothetical protein
VANGFGVSENAVEFFKGCETVRFSRQRRSMEIVNVYCIYSYSISCSIQCSKKGMFLLGLIFRNVIAEMID